MWACKNGHKETLHLLLADERIDPDLTDNVRKVPMKCYCRPVFPNLLSVRMVKQPINRSGVPMNLKSQFYGNYFRLAKKEKKKLIPNFKVFNSHFSTPFPLRRSDREPKTRMRIFLRPPLFFLRHRPPRLPLYLPIIQLLYHKRRTHHLPPLLLLLPPLLPSLRFLRSIGIVVKL